MSKTIERVPAHLRQYVARQDYGTYDEIDQSVWRFILIQTHARLRHSAHPAYVEGLARTGIDIERIPRIEQMDACLAEYGWGAVCVDGFIPPRAFQEFQALGIMTIAGEIRSCEHLAYTPAPDIVHESAGHAPIVPDPTYRRYLQRFGEIGARAFTHPRDAEQHAAIHALSELKEDPAALPAQVEAAEARLEQQPNSLSEAALVARLHWWTVEYGLIGTPDDYRLYGAGLLSSLGESYFCHEPRVAKLPLDASCIAAGYDITRPQPRLYVAESFEQLLEVLDEVADGLAQRRGDAYALSAAQSSAELATLELDSGVCASGVLAEVHGDELAVFEPGFALARDGRHLDGAGPQALAGRCACLLAAGGELPTLEPGSDVDFRVGSHWRVHGRLERAAAPVGRGTDWLVLRNARIARGDRVEVAEPELVIVAGGPLRAAFAGPADPGFWPPTGFPQTSVPRRRTPAAQHRALLALYHEALALWREPDSPALVPGFERIAEQLRSKFPEDWLLRWNLLECLRKVDHGVVLASRLRDELLEVEERYPRDAPITMGLRYLGFEPRVRGESDG
jgi:phenylalanine-4-hydroxylase